MIIIPREIKNNAYAKFLGGQTKCILGNSKIPNTLIDSVKCEIYGGTDFCSHGVTSSLRQLITNVKTQLQALLVSDVKIVGFTDNMHLTTEVFSSMKVKRWMRVETARPCRGDRSV